MQFTKSKVDQTKTTISTTEIKENNFLDETINEANTNLASKINFVVPSLTNIDLKAVLSFYHNHVLLLLKKTMPNLSDIQQYFHIQMSYRPSLQRFHFTPLSTIEEYQKLIQYLMGTDCVVFRNYQSSMDYNAFANDKSVEIILEEFAKKDELMPQIINALEQNSPHYFQWCFIDSNIEEMILHKKIGFNHAFIYALVSWVCRSKNDGREEHFLLKRFQMENKILEKFSELNDILYY